MKERESRNRRASNAKHRKKERITEICYEEKINLIIIVMSQEQQMIFFPPVRERMRERRTIN